MVANNPKMNGVKIRKGGRGQNNSARNLRSNKVPNLNSSSANWRDIGSKGNNNVANEANSYGYKNPYVTDAFYLMVGLQVQIQKTDGNIYEGILETVSNNLDFHLCNVSQKVQCKENEENGRSENKLIFHFRDISYCKVNDVDMEFGKKDSFLTDAAIAASNMPIQQRELVQWKDDDLHGSSATGLLEDDLHMNGSWDFEDMYRENEEKHGVRSTFDSSLNSYMTPIEKRDDETYKEQERRAEQIAREMQNFIDHETADSGVGEEEMFSAVSRTSSITNNDGFATYTRNVRNIRGKASNNVVGPRLQRQNFSNKHQDQLNQMSNNSNQPNRNQVTAQQAQSGDLVMRNSSSVYPNQQISSQQHVESIGATSDVTRVSHQLDNVSITQAGGRTMSYSAVTMKKQQQLACAKVNQSSKPLQSLPQQPNISSMPTPPLSDAPTSSSPPAVSFSQQSHNQNTSPEALAAAKQQVIQNSKNYASIASHSVVHSQANVKSNSQALGNSECNTSHESLLPKSQEHHQTQSLNKSMQERKTLLPEQKDSSQVAPDLNVKEHRDGIKSGLNKYGKVHHTQNAGDEQKLVDVNELKEFGRDFKLATDKSAKKTSKTRSVPSNSNDISEWFNAKRAVTSESSVSTTTTPVTTAPVTTAVKTTASTVVLTSENIVSKSGKEFSFNPSAKEFCPNKPNPTKPSTYTMQMSGPPQTPVYFQTQQAPIVFNYGVSHDVLPLQNKNFTRLIYNVPTVYGVPAADINNQATSQQVVAQPNYMHAQSVTNQSFFIVNNQGTYQQVVPGPQGQYIQMTEVASPVFRYVSPQGQPGMTHARIATNYQPTDAVSGNFMFSVSQPHNLQQHQSPANPHSSYSAPSPSLMQHGYVVSQHPSSNYPQIASPVTHPQVAASYRNPTPIHQVTSQQPHHHQQQSYIMLGHQHMAGVPLSSNHGYIQNQQHGPVYQNN